MVFKRTAQLHWIWWPRARKEYWMFILVNFIFALVLSIVDKILGWEWASGEGVLTSIYAIFILLPSWAVQFHAASRHGSFRLVVTAAVNPGSRVDCDFNLQLSERDAG